VGGGVQGSSPAGCNKKKYIVQESGTPTLDRSEIHGNVVRVPPIMRFSKPKMTGLLIICAGKHYEATETEHLRIKTILTCGEQYVVYLKSGNPYVFTTVRTKPFASQLSEINV
jgi:hypothetical protein